MIEKLQVNEVEFSEKWDWKDVSFAWWYLATQSDGSIQVSLWDTMLLVTAVLNKNPDPNKDFTPLAVDFRENYYAAGKIGWWPYRKREWRPSDGAIITSRLIDRCIRPMFPSWMVNDVIITLSAMQIDKENLPAVPWIIWASLAIMMAWIPFEWPISWVRIWYKDNNFIINPTYKELEEWELDLIVCGSKDTITMVEAGANQISTEIMMEAMDLAQREITRLCEWQESFLQKFHIEKKEVTQNLPSNYIMDRIREQLTVEKLEKFYPSTKKQLTEIYDNYEKEVLDMMKDDLVDPEKEDVTLVNVKTWIFKVMKSFVRKKLLEEWKRVDGRKSDVVRPLHVKVWLNKRNHWVWVFQRGETQVMSITTIGAPWDVQLIDSMESDNDKQRFMHHYNMLPFATNEARMYRWAWRREIWHWRLAEKALEGVLPDGEKFPYTMRVVSEVLSCNGSTSMASVCASCLSLMDAWVPIINPVSWIAMWLVIGESDGSELWENVQQLEDWRKYIILTDIQWLEDFTWDMDFKVAGTKKGINALQMDMKIKWLPLHVLKQAIQQANGSRLEILDFMLENAIDKPREDLNEYAPRIQVLKIDPSKIRTVIWTWWSNVQEIIRQTWVDIDFQDDGTTFITAKDSKGMQAAIDMINESIWEPSPWDKLDTVITRVEAYWVFVKLWKTKLWLCHVRNLWQWFIKDPSSLYKVGDKISVEVIKIDADNKIQVKKS